MATHALKHEQLVEAWEALGRADGNVSQAARLLGMNRMTYTMENWRWWAALDMKRATDNAMERLRLMGCPDPEAYLEEAMLDTNRRGG